MIDGGEVEDIGAHKPLIQPSTRKEGRVRLSGIMDDRISGGSDGHLQDLSTTVRFFFLAEAKMKRPASLSWNMVLLRHLRHDILLLFEN